MDDYLNKETPFPAPSIKIANNGVRKTPTTLAKIALNIAVPMFPPTQTQRRYDLFFLFHYHLKVRFTCSESLRHTNIDSGWQN